MQDHGSRSVSMGPHICTPVFVLGAHFIALFQHRDWALTENPKSFTNKREWGGPASDQLTSVIVSDWLVTVQPIPVFIFLLNGERLCLFLLSRGEK